MSEVIKRLEAVRTSVGEALANPSRSDVWQHAEFCYLQLRRTCEYIAVAILVAHGEHPEFLSNTLLKEWNAEKLFKAILRLNKSAFPVPATIATDYHAAGFHHVTPIDGRLTASDLQKIYVECSQRIHVGSLARIRSGNLPPLDLPQIVSWHNRFIQTLEVHLILLPSLQSVLLVVLKDREDGKVHCTFADANDSPSISAEGLRQANFAVVEKL